MAPTATRLLSLAAVRRKLVRSILEADRLQQLRRDNPDRVGTAAALADARHAVAACEAILSRCTPGRREGVRA